MIFVPLYSGSSGNALLIVNEGTKVLIDAGKPGNWICQALHAAGVNPEDLDGIIVTHEHSDHVHGVGVMARKYHIPVYANIETWNAMAYKIGNVPQDCVRIAPDSDFYIGNVGIEPFDIPHDAAHPVGYRLWAGDCSVSTATDLGRFTKKVCDRIAGSSLILLESNHDVDMLRANPGYSSQLKTRILGNHGHLSNDACAEAMMQLLEKGTSHFILGHLSGENNTPELALQVSTSKAKSAGLKIGKDIFIDVAYRDHVSNGYNISSSEICLK